MVRTLPHPQHSQHPGVVAESEAECCRERLRTLLCPCRCGGCRPPTSQLHYTNICLVPYTSLSPLFMMLGLILGVGYLHLQSPKGSLSGQLGSLLSEPRLALGWHSTPTPSCSFPTTENKTERHVFHIEQVPSLL